MFGKYYFIFKARVSRVQWKQGKTNTGGALERARTRLFANSRPNVPKVILVVTDGEATDKEKVIEETALLKEAGFLIYAVGVGDQINEDELINMATDKDSVYFTRNYDLEFETEKYITVFTNSDSLAQNSLSRYNVLWRHLHKK